MSGTTLGGGEATGGRFVRQDSRFRDRITLDGSSGFPAEAGRYQVPGLAGTVDFDHIERHYYGTHQSINPTGIVPAGPLLDLDAPHGRG